MLVVVVAAVVAIAALGKRRVRILGDELVEEAIARARDAPRPAHRLPAQGTTFQACLGPLIDAAPDGGLFPLSEADREQVDEVLEGRAAVATLAPHVRELISRDLPAAEAALACARAPMHGEAPGLGPFASWSHSRQRRVSVYQPVAKLGLLQGRALAESGRAVEGLERCSDVLAFSRDTVRDRGLVGAMLCTAMLQRAPSACGAAIDAADRSARQRFVAELGATRAGLPSFGEVLEMERVSMQLIAWGDFLSEAQLRRLPDNARDLAAEQIAGTLAGSWINRPARLLYWPGYVEVNRALVAATHSATRDSAFDAAEAETSWAEQLSGFSGHAPGTMGHFMRRYDVVPLELDLLESAARVALGERPLRTVSLRPFDGGVELRVEWDAGVGASVFLHPDAQDSRQPR